MFDAAKILEKAKRSAFWLWVLNRVHIRMVPFNIPHEFEIVELSDDRLKARIPYRRSNFNHIRGLHACASATLSEFATGFLLLGAAREATGCIPTATWRSCALRRR